jgi:hypothetical protein
LYRVSLCKFIINTFSDTCNGMALWTAWNRCRTLELQYMCIREVTRLQLKYWNDLMMTLNNRDEVFSSMYTIWEIPNKTLWHIPIFLIHDHALSWFDMVIEPTSAYKHKNSFLYYIHNAPPICFSHTFGHPYGGAL